jgi:hypothetical protein
LRVATKFLQPLKRVDIEGIAKKNQTDTYSKKMTLRNHLLVLAAALPFGTFTLGFIAKFSKHPRMQRLRVPQVSKSQLSKLHSAEKLDRPKTTSKPKEYIAFAEIYQQFLKYALRSLNFHSQRSEFLLIAIDASKKRGKVKMPVIGTIEDVIEVDGIKLHLAVIPGVRKIPLVTLSTEPTVHDNTQFRTILKRTGELVDLVGQNVILLFDLGYYDFEQFEEMIDAGIFFISRVKKNAAFEVISTISNDSKATDQIVKVKGCKHPLRLITLKGENGQIWRYFTNVYYLVPQEIGTIYGFRWDIEINNREENQTLKMNRFFGKSFNAVMIEIFVIMIVQLLMILFSERMGLDYTLHDLTEFIHLYFDVDCSCFDYTPRWKNG